MNRPNSSGAWENMFAITGREFRQGVKIIKEEFRDPDWKHLVRCLHDTLLEGATQLETLATGTHPNAEGRYRVWLFDASCRLLEHANSTLSWLAYMGGPFPTNAPVHVLPVMQRIDRCLVDVALLTTKLPPPASLHPGVGGYAISAIDDHGDKVSLAGDARVEKYKNLLQQHQQTALAYLVRSLLDLGNARWLVVQFWERDESPHVDARAGRGIAGSLGPLRFHAASTGAELSAALQATHGTPRHPVLEEQFDLLLKGRTGAFSYERWCVFAALPWRVFNIAQSITGLTSLMRASDTASWCRNSVAQADQEHPLIGTRDPSPSCALAVLLEPSQVLVEHLDKFEIAIPIHVQLRHTCSPLDQRELDDIVSELGFSDPKHRFLEQLLSLDVQGYEYLDRLRKALHFWSRAELLRTDVTADQATAWTVADVFLSYCTVLETLLGDKSDVAATLSSRVAGIITSSPSERVDAARRIKALYGKRSQYVHAGSAVVTLEEMTEMRELARACFLDMYHWGCTKLGELIRENNTLDSEIDEQTNAEAVRTITVKNYLLRCDERRFGAG